MLLLRAVSRRCSHVLRPHAWVGYRSTRRGENASEPRRPPMSKLIRNISSFMSGRADPSSDTQRPDAVPTAPATTSSLPVVAQAVTDEEMMESPRLRRSRSVSLLRSSSAVTTSTSRVAPTLPSHSPRPSASAAPASRPFLTQTERVRLQVMQAQIQLASLRLYEGPIDGVLSASTATALRHFQTLKGLRPSGTLAAGTLAALGVPVID
jgi:Putative peptidoglycan binding domain